MENVFHFFLALNVWLGLHIHVPCVFIFVKSQEYDMLKTQMNPSCVNMHNLHN
jgi:hypothetical protein